nr:unnamed protein product [Callosobruchus chinensis]
MKITAFFLVFISVLVCQVQADAITVVVNIILTIIKKNLERDEYYVGLIPDVVLRFPEAVKDLAAGTLELKNVRLRGFKDAEKTLKAIGTKDTEYSIQDVKVYFNAPQVSLEMQYDADLGFVDEIPIYGTGSIRLEISKFLFNFATEVSISKTQWLKDTTVESLNIDLGFRHSSKDIFQGKYNLEDTIEKLITSYNRNENITDLVTTIKQDVNLRRLYYNGADYILNTLGEKGTLKEFGL